MKPFPAGSASDSANHHVRKVVDFRNILVHGYESIDHAIVWKTVEDHLPILISEVETLIESP